jgi:hypothetical protein
MTTGTVEMATYSDNVAVVSTHDEHHNTIQEALSSGKNRVHVHELTRGQTWPVEIDRKVHVSSDYGMKVEGQIDTAFKISVGNKRPPGVLVTGFDVHSVGTAFEVSGSKYVTFRDCHVEGAKHAWVFKDTEDNATNSNKLDNCTIQKTKDTGIVTDSMTHSLVLDSVRIMHCGGYGVFANGPANVSITSSQIEDCVEAGVKLRRCESPSVENSYLEANGYDADDASCEVLVENSNSSTVEHNYLNGLGKTRTGVNVIGDPQATVDNSYRGYTHQKEAIK